LVYDILRVFSHQISVTSLGEALSPFISEKYLPFVKRLARLRLGNSPDFLLLVLDNACALKSVALRDLVRSLLPHAYEAPAVVSRFGMTFSSTPHLREFLMPLFVPLTAKSGSSSSSSSDDNLPPLPAIIMHRIDATNKQLDDVLGKLIIREEGGLLEELLWLFVRYPQVFFHPL